MLKVPLQSLSLAVCMESGLPMSQNPPLGLAGSGPKERRSQYVRDQVDCRIFQTLIYHQAASWGSSPVFLSGFTPLAFGYAEPSARQWDRIRDQGRLRVC